MPEFHVLIVDDRQELIQKVGSRIPSQHNIAGSHWQIVFHEVHVRVTDQNGIRFADASLQALVEACRHKPDLLLFDYGFSKPENMALPPTEYFKNILSPADLTPALRDFLQRKYASNKKLTAQLQSNFFANPCRLYLYTYTGKEFQGVPPTPKARAILTQRAFPDNEVVLVDVSDELFENDAFSGEDDHFRAYLTAGLLSQIIQRELLMRVIAHENERLRFVRYYRSGASVFVIILLGGAIGALGEWLGARIMALTMAGLGLMALVLAVLAGIIFFILGLGIPLVFERLMSHLLAKVKAEEVTAVDFRQPE